jgi:hypothetical protein
MNPSEETPHPRRRTREEVTRLVSEFEAGDLPAGEFCRRHTLAPSTLRRRLNKQPVRQGKAETGVRLVTVKVKGVPGPLTRVAGLSLEVILAGGRRLGVAPGFDAETLGRLVRALEDL